MTRHTSHRLPAGDVTIGPGDVLRYLGIRKGVARWRSPDGIIVTTQQLDTPQGRVRAVAVQVAIPGYWPGAGELEGVRRAFFPSGNVGQRIDEARCRVLLYELAPAEEPMHARST